MVRLVEGSWLIGVNDAWDYNQCPQAFLNAVDSARGIAAMATPVEQPLRRLMGQVLQEHRQRLVADLSGRTENLVTIDPPVLPGVGPDQLVAHWLKSAKQTRDALTQKADVVVKPVFTLPHNGPSPQPILWCWSVDFLVASPTFAPEVDQWEKGYEAWEGKLGSSSMGKTLLRLAATKHLLDREGVACTNRVRIVFANGPDTQRGVHHIIDQWVNIRSALVADLTTHLESGEPMTWSNDSVASCGRKTCGWCSRALRHHDDLFRIPGISRENRVMLRSAGFSTTTDFAHASYREAESRVDSISRPELTTLHTQAKLIVLARESDQSPPPFEITNRSVLESLPEPSEGDLFIDFEANPTFRAWSPADPYFPTPHADHPRWWLGMDYLFGVLGRNTDSPGEGFDAYWSKNFSEEEENFRALLEHLSTTLSTHPDAHLYHYAPYEKIAMRRMAQRYRIGRDQVMLWQRAGVFVDLHKTVTKALIAGIPNYSLKSVEKLLLPPGQRNGIGSGEASVESAWEYFDALERGDVGRAATLRKELTDYNFQDTASTRELLTWLHTLRAS
jgi:uncharacterized protein